MARHAALVAKFGVPRVGRETQATKVFMEVVGFLSQANADGRCEEPQLFFNYDGSGGMMIAAGQSDALMAMMDSDEWQRLSTLGQLIVENLTIDLCITAEEVLNAVQVATDAQKELGFA